MLSIIFLIINFKYAQAQVSSINQTLSEVKANIDLVNQYANSQKIKEAVMLLNETQRDYDRYITHYFDDEFRKARDEDPSYIPSINVQFSNKLTAAYWEDRVKRSQKNIDRTKEALSEGHHRRTLDTQDEAWSYLKAIYDGVKAIKDVVENVGTMEYVDAVKSAKEGIDGFIDNYKKIEEAKLQIINTELYETEVRGLIRRAERMEEANWQFASYMRVYEDNVNDFLRVVERMHSRVGQLSNESIVDWSSPEYSWNSQSSLNKINKLKSDFKAGDFDYESLEIQIRQVIEDAENNKIEVSNNIYALNAPDKFDKANQLEKEFDDFNNLAYDVMDECSAFQKNKAANPIENMQTKAIVPFGEKIQNKYFHGNWGGSEYGQSEHAFQQNGTQVEIILPDGKKRIGQIINGVLKYKGTEIILMPGEEIERLVEQEYKLLNDGYKMEIKSIIGDSKNTLKLSYRNPQLIKQFDNDQDRVHNKFDKCPNTQHGLNVNNGGVDIMGCPTGKNTNQQIITVPTENEEEVIPNKKEAVPDYNNLFAGSKVNKKVVTVTKEAPKRKTENRSLNTQLSYGNYWEKTLLANTETDWIYYGGGLEVRHKVDNRTVCYQLYYDPEFKFLKKEVFYDNFILKHGPYREFAKDKRTQKVYLKLTGYYRLNKKVGPWVTYNQDRTVSKVEYWIDDKKVEDFQYKTKQQQDKSLPPIECYKTYDWLGVKLINVKDKPEMITIADFQEYGFNFADKYGVAKKVDDDDIKGLGTERETIYYTERLYAKNAARQELGTWCWYLYLNDKKILRHIQNFGNFEIIRRDYMEDGSVKELFFVLRNDLMGTGNVYSNSITMKIGPHYNNDRGNITVKYYDGKDHDGKDHEISKAQYGKLYEVNNLLPHPEIYKQSGALKYPKYKNYDFEVKPSLNSDLVEFDDGEKVWQASIDSYGRFTVKFVKNHRDAGYLGWEDIERKIPRQSSFRKGFYSLSKGYIRGKLSSFGITPAHGNKYYIRFDENGEVTQTSERSKNYQIYLKYFPDYVYPEPSNSMINSPFPEFEFPKDEITPLYESYIKSLKNPSSVSNLNQVIASQNETSKDSDRKTEDDQSEADNYQQLQRQEFFTLAEEIQKIIEKADESFNKKYWNDPNSSKVTMNETNPKQEAFDILRRAIPKAKAAKYRENEAALNYLLAMKFTEYSGRVFGNKAKQDFFIEAAQLIVKTDQLIPQIKHLKTKADLSDMYCTSAEVWRDMTRKAQWGAHAYNKMACDKKVIQQYERAVQTDPNNQKARRILENLKAPKKAIPAAVEKFEAIPDESWNKAQEEMFRMDEERSWKELNKKPEINYLEVCEMTLEFLEGSVSLWRSGAESWELVTDTHIYLFNRDKIKTSDDARGVSITYTSDRTFLAIKNSAEVEIIDENSLIIKRGGGCVQVHKKGSKFVVITPTGVIGVRGTKFEVNVKADKTTETYLYEGVVEARNGSDIAYLVPGQKMVAKKGEDKLQQSNFNAQQRLETHWRGFDQQKRKHEQIVINNKSSQPKKKINPTNKKKTITKPKNNKLKSNNKSFAEFWSLNTYNNNIESFKQNVTTKTNKGFVPVGLNCANSQYEVLYLGGGVLSISAWNMEWYNDANSLQEGINKNMNQGYIPSGFSWDGKAYYVFYIKTNFKGKAWQIVPSALDLNAVSTAIKPFVDKKYTPMGITIFGDKYYTLLVQFDTPLANNWFIEGYNDKRSEIVKNINKKLPDGTVPWGILKSNGVANVLYIGI